MPPTVFADVDNSATIDREEIFGPVMSVIPFSSVDDVVAIANDNGYGLAAAVWTSDIRTALNAARALRAASYGSTTRSRRRPRCHGAASSSRASAASSEKEGVDDFLESKSVCVNLAE